MRRRITFLLLLLCLVLALPVTAHSGGTDANGGHYDGGSYHYHHGYPAHQHTGGVCPYDFDDRTGWNSGTSGSSGSSTSKSHDSTPTPKPGFTFDFDGLWFFGFIGISFAGFCLWGKLSDLSAERRTARSHGMTRKQYRAYLERQRQEKRREEFLEITQQSVAMHQLSRWQSYLDDEREREQAMAEWRHERRLIADALLRAVYSGRTPTDFVEIPSFVEFGDDGLPKVKGEGGWGNIYTVYFSRSGSVAHSNPHCNKAICYRMHIFEAYPEFPLCSRCGKLPPYGFEWYWQYRKIQKEFVHLGIPLNPPKLLPPPQTVHPPYSHTV